MLLNYEMLKESLYSYKAKDNKIKRMCEKKEIIKLTKNLYETNLNIEGYLVANAIYSPSYLSFDYALSYYNLIPEMTKTYTSATYNKNKTKKYMLVYLHIVIFLKKLIHLVLLLFKKVNIVIKLHQKKKQFVINYIL